MSGPVAAALAGVGLEQVRQRQARPGAGPVSGVEGRQARHGLRGEAVARIARQVFRAKHPDLGARNGPAAFGLAALDIADVRDRGGIGQRDAAEDLLQQEHGVDAHGAPVGRSDVGEVERGGGAHQVVDRLVLQGAHLVAVKQQAARLAARLVVGLHEIFDRRRGKATEIGQRLARRACGCRREGRGRRRRRRARRGGGGGGWFALLRARRGGNSQHTEQ